MTYRQTYVAEYPSASDAPGVTPKTECMGGRLVSVQFSDALEELSRICAAAEALIDSDTASHQCADDDRDCPLCNLQKALEATE